MKQKHGKPQSSCCNAKLLKVVNGEWTEWVCQKCGTNLDENGQPYRYTPCDVTNRPR